jgi:hypothetical protein
MGDIQRLIVFFCRSFGSQSLSGCIYRYHRTSPYHFCHGMLTNILSRSSEIKLKPSNHVYQAVICCASILVSLNKVQYPFNSYITFIKTFTVLLPAKAACYYTMVKERVKNPMKNIL